MPFQASGRVCFSGDDFPVEVLGVGMEDHDHCVECSVRATLRVGLFRADDGDSACIMGWMAVMEQRSSLVCCPFPPGESNRRKGMQPGRGMYILRVML